MRLFLAYRDASPAGESTLKLVQEIKRQLVALGSSAFDPRERPESASFSQGLPLPESEMRISDVVVAVLSADSQAVGYEVGLAAGLGRPIVLAAPVGHSISAMLSEYPLVVLGGDDQIDALEVIRVADQVAASQPRNGSASSGPRIMSVDDLRTNPHLVSSLSGPDFEKAVAAILTEQGFHVDDSRNSSLADLIASREADDGQVVSWIVQTKQSRTGTRIGVETVLRLADQVSRYPSVSGGILVSNVPLTAAAAQLASQTDISVVSSIDLLEWLGDPPWLPPLASGIEPAARIAWLKSSEALVTRLERLLEERAGLETKLADAYVDAELARSRVRALETALELLRNERAHNHRSHRSILGAAASIVSSVLSALVSDSDLPSDQELSHVFEMATQVVVDCEANTDRVKVRSALADEALRH